MALLYVNRELGAISPADLFVGELSLDGDISPIRGVVSICHMAQKKGYSRVFIPEGNQLEASIISDIHIVPVRTLSQVHQILEDVIPAPKLTRQIQPTRRQTIDFQDVKGHLLAKRALEIAAAGHHNVLLLGSPGSGKSMLLKRMPSILPDLTIDEAISSFKLKSISGKKQAHNFSLNRPFRAPHYSISYAGLVGGGQSPLPGEISLAHNGILFLDEIAEFPRQVLEVLRQPLEDHQVTICRANFTVTYPAKFMLVAAMNPCPCGYRLDSKTSCQCSATQCQKYWKRISGPILDRIDIIFDIPRMGREALLETPPQPKDPYRSIAIKKRILQARATQRNRQGRAMNGHLSANELDEHCRLSTEIKAYLGTTLDKGKLTGRSLHKIIKVARTVADLEESQDIQLPHIMEAFQYRKVDFFFPKSGVVSEG